MSTPCDSLERTSSVLSPELCGCAGDRETDDDGRSVRDLRAANRQMREFLALVAHELRNPLAAIGYALSVLDHQGDNAAKRDWVRNLVDRQARCIGRMVEDLLDASRIEHGKLRLSKRPVDLAQVVAHAVETTHAAVAARGHRLEVAVPAEPVRLDADPVRLEQVLMNLLTNAAKYTEPGGHIRLTAEVEGGEVAFRVRDSGIGIAADMLPRVFDPFWQVERTLDRAQGGLGLGLALVRQVAELHGGSATASSAGLNRGSEFVVRLPADPVPTGHAPANRHE